MGHSSLKAVAEQPENKEGWRPFLAIFFITASLSLAGLAVFNFVVNPAGYYPAHFFPRLTPNDIVEKQELLDRVYPPPGAVIFGSSRSMMLSPHVCERLTHLKCFNAATSGGDPQDISEMFDHALTRTPALKLAIIGLDAEMFHNGVHPTAHLPSKMERARGLISADMAQQSGRSLWMHLTTGYPPRLRAFDSNGLLVEADDHKDFSIRNDVLLATYRPMWQSFTGLSAQSVEHLRSVLKNANARGVRVVMFLTPRHPEMRESLNAPNFEHRTAEFKTAFPHLCREWNVTCADLTAPESFGGTLDDFRDFVHVGDKNAELLLQHLLGEPRAF